MKNSTVVNEWLDACEETFSLIRRSSDDPDIVALVPEHSDYATELWQARQDDGWTIEELEKIYVRRFETGGAARRS